MSEHAESTQAADTPAGDAAAQAAEQAASERRVQAEVGVARELRGHQPLILDEPDYYWEIRTGGVEVLGTRIEDGAPTTLRRHCMHVGERRAVFGHTPLDTPKDNLMGFMAVATGTTEVVRRHTADLEVALGGPRFRSRAALESLEHWVTELGRIMTVGSPPSRSPSRLPPVEPGEPTEPLVFGKDEEIAGHTQDVMWMRLSDGELALFGIDDFQVSTDNGFLLVSPEMWLQVRSEEATIEYWPLNRVPYPGALRDAIAGLHRLLGRYLEKERQDNDRAEIRRRALSEELRQLKSAAAFQELASVLDPKEIYPRRDDHLLTAATVVGQQLGLQVNPIPPSEDLSRVKHPMEAIARASKVRARMVLLGVDWWTRDLGPLVAFLGDEARQPIALLPNGSGYDYIDPSKSLTRQPLTAEVRDEICSDAYMFYRSLPEKVGGVLDLLRFTGRKNGGDILFALMMGVFATLLGLIVPRATGTLVDKAIPFADTGLVWQLFIILAVAGIATGVFTFAQLMTTVRTGVRAEVTAQSAMWDRLLRLRPDFFRDYSSGDLQTRVSAVSEIARELNGATLRPMITGVLALLNFLLLWYYSWDLAKIAIWASIVVLLVTIIASYFVRRLSYTLHDLEGDFHGLMTQLIGGVGKLRTSGSEHRAFNHWVSKYTQQLRYKLRIQFIQDLIKVFNLGLGPVATAVLFWKAVDLTIDLPIDDEKRITTGDFIAFNTAFTLFLAGWQDVSNTLVSVLDSVVKGRRIQPLLSGEPEVGDEAADPGRLTGDIRLENVSFRYSPDGPLILDQVHCEARPGEYIAFVGPSGSGKSTILRMLLGFERPEYGRVLYDGQDLAGLDVLAVRRQIGSVLQEGRLSAGSVMDNLANNAVVTHGEAWDAVADAGMSDDIEAMPMGLHTVVSEGGGNLSGGQRQRLLIARALATRPKIVMFDEATSALDNKTQATVSEALDRRKVTRLVIAHRLSTIRNADRIYVLEKGRIVQQGSFEDLSAQPGLFRELMRRQMA
ncbi:MAG: NHLP bacteriocin export ABC transporter permease/ATPase subunit [Gammaproteobacteria bacterium]|nr:NHLP bacteriocin export ABC transporter permease/ATPase subunit [Gammaproteobacteria bacterium]